MAGNMTAMPPMDPSWAAENKGPTIIAFLCVLVPLSTFFCAMRLYTRGIIMGKLQLDDYFITASVVSTYRLLRCRAGLAIPGPLRPQLPLCCIRLAGRPAHCNSETAHWLTLLTVHKKSSRHT